jgi:hypothetical protein
MPILLNKLGYTTLQIPNALMLAWFSLIQHFIHYRMQNMFSY